MSKNANLLLFAGTSEGRKLAEWLSDAGLRAVLCAATEYGRMTVPELSGIRVISGRLDKAAMARLMEKTGCEQVIDATHPYAVEATDNILAACQQAGRAYLRIIRPALGDKDGVVVPNTAGAVNFLDSHSGKALLTTGSKELEAFTSVKDYAARLYLRVLPDAQVVERCLELGFAADHLICMQGPFSEELNLALLRQTGAKYLVTKDSGTVGGLPEKVAAARQAGAAVVLIARPSEEVGHTLEEAIRLLEDRYGVMPKEKPVCTHFPLFVDLSGKKVVVAGGGKIALRRVLTLLRFGAAVTVAAPDVSPELAELAEQKKISLVIRPVQPEDFPGAFLALAVTGDSKVNRMVRETAHRLSIPVSVADDRDQGTFWFPAIIQEGGLTAGLVSDRGDAHARVKDKAEDIRRILKE